MSGFRREVDTTVFANYSAKYAKYARGGIGWGNNHNVVVYG